MDKNKELLFSIIVPIYKVEKYLHQCIKSILNQSYKNIEIILVDDGSPDRCPSICEHYKSTDERVVVVHKENGGLVSARQAGALISHGDYILCVDGDDWVSHDYVNKFFEIIKMYKCDVVCCNAFNAFGDKNEERIYGFRSGYYSLKDIKNEILPYAVESQECTYFPPSVWGKAIKREIYMEEQLKVDPNITIGEDGACIKPILFKINSMYIINDKLYYYRCNGESMTKIKKVTSWEEPLELLSHLKSRVSSEMLDLNKQYDRLLTILAFKTAVNQFYGNLSYIDVKKDIKKNINRAEYKKAIYDSEFSSKKGKIVKYILLFRCYLLLFLYSKFG